MSLDKKLSGKVGMLFGESLVWRNSFTQYGVDKELKKLLWPDNLKEDHPFSYT